eukprot:m.248876 g.248876  ORF g.248876 m.248876 type:complete len:53 (+) comp17164_c1_seq44:344-502(+)
MSHMTYRSYVRRDFNSQMYAFPRGVFMILATLGLLGVVCIPATSWLLLSTVF